MSSWTRRALFKHTARTVADNAQSSAILSIPKRQNLAYIICILETTRRGGTMRGAWCIVLAALPGVFGYTPTCQRQFRGVRR